MKRDLLTKVLTVGGFLLLFSGYIAFKTGYFDSLFASEKKPETPHILQPASIKPAISSDSVSTPEADSVIPVKKTSPVVAKPTEPKPVDPVLMSSKSAIAIDFKWFEKSDFGFDPDSLSQDSIIMDSLSK